MPPDSPIRLIAIDIDGTLLDGRGALPPRNRRAVHRAIEHGIQVVLATGRAFHHALPIAKALAPEHAPGAVALIVSNGALTKRADGTTVDSRLVPRNTARAIVEAMRPRHRGVAIIFDRPDAGQYVFERIDWSHPQRHWYYERNRAFITHVEPIDAALTEDPAQVAFTGGVEQMRALADEVRALPQGPEVTITLTEYAERDFSLLDLIAGGWSKGAALREHAHRLDLDSTAVMAVGDNLNDREMLEFAGRPVVMGNAVEPLKQLGWEITATHDECGLAAAIDAVIGQESVA
jgi:Cof subfamily protein (haloacid dehalogenase superfamily)